MAGFAERVWVVEPGIDHAGIAVICERFASFAASAEPSSTPAPPSLAEPSSTPAPPSLAESSSAAAAGAGVFGDRLIICDVGAIAHPDMATLSLLARLQLTARRLGRGIQLRGAQPRLGELILFSGLGGVLPLEPSPAGLTLQGGWEAEQREQPVHVEEVVHRPDPPA